MRVILYFSPTFISWGKAITKYWAANNPEIEVIALASSRKIYNNLKNDPALNFLVLDSIEDLEREWLNNGYDLKQLKKYEEALGSDEVGNTLIVDRLLGQGFVIGAERLDTELSRASFDDEKIRAYITNMLRYFDGLYEKYTPEFAFLYVIAGGIAFSLATTMRAKGAEGLHLVHSRISDFSIVDNDKTGLFTPIWNRYHNNESGEAAAVKWATNWLNEYREEQKLPFYVKFIKQEEKRRYSLSGFLKTAAKALVRYIYFDWLKRPKSTHTYSGIQGLKQAIFVPFLRRKIIKEKFYTPTEEIENKEFIYFPLHVNPEASTMCMAPDHTNQLSVIEALAKRKPLSMTLVVKEHPYMLGIRPRSFYKAILKMPGVVLVPPSTNSLSLIQKAALTATISGTVAWEALLEKKPVLVVGNSPYLSFKDGIAHCPDLSKIGQGIRDCLNVTPLADDKIIRYLSLLYEESFTVPTDLYWNQIDDAQMEENMNYVRDMAEGILARYHQVRAAKNPKSKPKAKAV